MPQVRTPVERAKITGADKINPARFKGRANPQTVPLGGAPGWMTGKTELAVWECFKTEIPWLMESDRGVVEIATRYRAQLWTDPHMAIAGVNLLRICLGQLGATPADRSKVMVPHEPEKDPNDRFFN